MRVAVRKGGAHVIGYEGNTVMPRRQVACLHLPPRTASSELAKRVRDYRGPPVPFRADPKFGWRLNYRAEMLASGKIEREWAVNSYGPDGTLDIFGRPAPTIADDRPVRYLREAGIAAR